MSTDAMVKFYLNGEKFVGKEVCINKLKVLLESAPDTPRNIAEEIAEKTGSQVVQVIGGAMIFYKENPELRKKEKEQKKAPAKKTANNKGAKDFAKKFKYKKDYNSKR